MKPITLAGAEGTCTYCHKLDPKTGAWHLASGQVKQPASRQDAGESRGSS